MISPADVRRYASDFLTFAADLVIPLARGPARFGEIMADFQIERFTALAPALHAVAAGRQPPIGRYWWEATKGASKDSDLAVALLWLLCFSPRTLACQVGAADADQASELRRAAAAIARLNDWLDTGVVIEKWTIRNPRTESRADIIATDTAGSHGARPDFSILNELSHLYKRRVCGKPMRQRGQGSARSGGGGDECRLRPVLAIRLARECSHVGPVVLPQI